MKSEGNQVGKPQYIEAYKKMLLVRLAEQHIQKEYFDNEMKTPVHLSIGAEAISVGVQSSLPENTKYFGTYRNHALYLTLTEDTDSFFGEMYGRVNGCAKGKAGSMHMSAPAKGLIATSAVVGTTIPLAVGAALGNQVLNRKGLVTVFMGDGACEEGVFWESLNFACLRRLNVLFVIEDNDLAIHTLGNDRRGIRSFAQVVGGYKCLFDACDGTDLGSVMDTTKRMTSAMQAEQCPGVLNMSYFRFLEHVGPLEDFKFGYRAKPDNMEMRYDPINKATAYLLNQGINKVDLTKWHDEIAAKIQESVQNAKSTSFADPAELFTDVLA